MLIKRTNVYKNMRLSFMINFIIIFSCLTLVEMKLWVLSTIWRKINQYLENLLFHQVAKTTPSIVQQIKEQPKVLNKKPSQTTQMHGKIYKINISDISSNSIESKSRIRHQKNKRILKQARKKVKSHNRMISNIGNQEANEIQKLFDALTQQISPILQKQSEDSSQTVKQYLFNLQASHPLDQLGKKYRKQAQGQKMNNPSHHRIKNRFMYGNDLSHRNINMKRFITKSIPIFQASRQQSQIQIKAHPVQSS